MSIKVKPISEKIGMQVINADHQNILDLDREEIINLFKKYGVLLFKNFQSNTEDFQEFSNSLSNNFRDYAGGAFNRKVINEDKTLLSVNDFQHEIKLHGEMYYQKNIPLLIWFFCANPASQDGETIICDGREIFNELSDSMKDILSKKKLKFTASATKEEWQKKYKADNIDELKEICKNNHTFLTIFEDESISLEYVCPAIVSSRCGKYQVFINSLLAAKQLNPKVIKFEDDSEISDELIFEIDKIVEKLVAAIAWEKGDILMIDNTRILHGRKAFSDPQRDIYIRLCDPAFPF